MFSPKLFTTVSLLQRALLAVSTKVIHKFGTLRSGEATNRHRHPGIQTTAIEDLQFESVLLNVWTSNTMSDGLVADFRLWITSGTEICAQAVEAFWITDGFHPSPKVVHVRHDETSQVFPSQKVA